MPSNRWIYSLFFDYFPLCILFFFCCYVHLLIICYLTWSNFELTSWMSIKRKRNFTLIVFCLSISMLLKIYIDIHKQKHIHILNFFDRSVFSADSTHFVCFYFRIQFDLLFCDFRYFDYLFSFEIFDVYWAKLLICIFANIWAIIIIVPIKWSFFLSLLKVSILHKANYTANKSVENAWQILLLIFCWK